MTLTAPTTLPEVRAWLAELQASGLRRVSELAAGRCDALIDPRKSNVFHGGCGVEHGAGSMVSADLATATEQAGKPATHSETQEETR